MHNGRLLLDPILADLQILFYLNMCCLVIFYRSRGVFYHVDFIHERSCPFLWLSEILSHLMKEGFQGPQDQDDLPIMAHQGNCLVSAGNLEQSVGARNRVGIRMSYKSARARIFKRLWSPGIDFKESIPPVYVTWRAGTITLFLTRFLTPIV